MAYDEILTERFRNVLKNQAVTEKRMMGGVCFLLHGNMIGGADRAKNGQGRFMFRVGKENDAAGAAMAGAEPMIQGGRHMRGFFFVDAETCDDARLRRWIDLALNFVKTLPPK